jgi:hypothetical protein
MLQSLWGCGVAGLTAAATLKLHIQSSYVNPPDWFTLALVTLPKNESDLHRTLCADTPVLRHFSYANDFYGAQKGWTLTIRVISQVYNYDYIMDTILNVDGTFEKRVVTSG